MPIDTPFACVSLARVLVGDYCRPIIFGDGTPISLTGCQPSPLTGTIAEGARDVGHYCSGLIPMCSAAIPPIRFS
jgi:hypothetical protein